MLAVAPSELHIVLPLKITPPPAESKAVDSEPSAISGSRGAEVKQIAFTPARAPHWVIPLQESATSPLPQASSSSDTQKPGGLKSPKNPLDPATFIRVFEETKSGSHLCRYEPVRKSAKNPSQSDVECESSTPHSLQFGVDLESSILIVSVAGKMGDDPALNKLYVTAKLASGDSSKDLVVTGYSEIGRDKSAMAAQSGRCITARFFTTGSTGTLAVCFVSWAYFRRRSRAERDTKRGSSACVRGATPFT